MLASFPAYLTELPSEVAKRLTPEQREKAAQWFEKKNEESQRLDQALSYAVLPERMKQATQHLESGEGEPALHVAADIHAAWATLSKALTRAGLSRAKVAAMSRAKSKTRRAKKTGKAKGKRPRGPAKAGRARRK